MPIFALHFSQDPDRCHYKARPRTVQAQVGGKPALGTQNIGA
jgi:hypothetical protein